MTLPGTASAWPPTAAIASRISLRRPVIVTLAPSRANVVAMAAPMPVPPPVTMATLSASRMEVSCSGLNGRVRACGSRSRVHDVLQHGLGRRTDDPVDDRAPLEEQDRRDRPDA